MFRLYSLRKTLKQVISFCFLSKRRCLFEKKEGNSKLRQKLFEAESLFVLEVRNFVLFFKKLMFSVFSFFLKNFIVRIKDSFPCLPGSSPSDPNTIAIYDRTYCSPKKIQDHKIITWDQLCHYYVWNVLDLYAFKLSPIYFFHNELPSLIKNLSQ